MGRTERRGWLLNEDREMSTEERMPRLSQVPAKVIQIEEQVLRKLQEQRSALWKRCEGVSDQA